MILGVLAAALLTQGDSKAVAELVSARSIVRPGEEFTVGVRIVTDPGWHVYYRNAGDTGMPTDIRWKLPKDWKSSGTLWPTPRIFGEEGLINYGYEGEAILLSRISVPKASPKGKQTLEADVSWLVCNDVCLQGSAKLTTQVTVGSSSSANKTWQPKLAEAWGKLPSLVTGWTLLAEATNTGFVLDITPPAEEFLPNAGFVFIPASASIVEHMASNPVTKLGSKFMLHLNKSEYATDKPKRLEGLLLIPREGEAKALKIDIPVQYRGERL